MIDVKTDDNDLLKPLSLYEQENAELKSQNVTLRKENKDLRCQIAELTYQIITRDKIILANQKNYETDKLYDEDDYEGAIKLLDKFIVSQGINGGTMGQNKIFIRGAQESRTPVT